MNISVVTNCLFPAWQRSFEFYKKRVAPTGLGLSLHFVSHRFRSGLRCIAPLGLGLRFSFVLGRHSRGRLYYYDRNSLRTATIFPGPSGADNDPRRTEALGGADPSVLRAHCHPNTRKNRVRAGDPGAEENARSLYAHFGM